MLAKPDGGHLREGPNWAYEYKLDGYRAAMRIATDGTTVLTSRNGLDLTAEFAEPTGVLTAALRGRAAVLDGEVVVYNEAGQIDFSLLQQRRGRFQKHRTARRTEAFEDVPARFLAFDLLQLDHQGLLSQPYEHRRRQLTELPMPDPFRIAIVPSFSADQLAAERLTPQRLLERVATEGHEGLVAKRLDSPYLPGKRPDFWCKHPLVQTHEVIVCGWRPGQSGFTGTVGGLLLGAHNPNTGDLVYIGDVGTGFTRQDRDQLRDRLQPLERAGYPFATPPPREDVVRARWVDPVLVGEVRFRQFTRGDDGRLRHTAWRGLRADRDPADVLAPQPGRPSPSPAPTTPELGSRVTVNAGGRTLTLSNLNKALYPDGTTKSEVIAYYSRIAPVLLPHLAARPVTFVRFPNGVHGQKFFQKNTDASAPSWLPTVSLRGRGSRRSADADEIVRYPLIHELAALVWAANLAALELHVPQWTVSDGARDLPNRLVFDLDPGPGTTIVDCCRVAERLHEVLVADGLTPRRHHVGIQGNADLRRHRGHQRANALDVCEGRRSGFRTADTAPGNCHDGEEPPRGQSVHRLEPEQPGEDHHHALLTTWPRRTNRGHTSHLGRGPQLQPPEAVDVHRGRGGRSGCRPRGPPGTSRTRSGTPSWLTRRLQGSAARTSTPSLSPLWPPAGEAARRQGQGVGTNRCDELEPMPDGLIARIDIYAQIGSQSR
ncbi:DNA ligase D [Lentzea sp. BCCO 10_0798]|uniref:DNA ligase (ATP) n=1 Tax=Lentzea kristufekii TaxID=3095430 RepID=A0ABU4U012_9PSEU|nr:DNA ligase D [Lentzea sp. BCCO 10_0798]MDX8053846.1 DNA ligase D [Lentzea sp. BCCO 10_0798]